MVAPAGGGPHAEWYSFIKRTLGAAWRAVARTSQIRSVSRSSVIR